MRAEGCEVPDSLREHDESLVGPTLMVLQSVVQLRHLVLNVIQPLLYTGNNCLGLQQGQYSCFVFRNIRSTISLSAMKFSQGPSEVSTSISSEVTPYTCYVSKTGAI